MRKLKTLRRSASIHDSVLQSLSSVKNVLAAGKNEQAAAYVAELRRSHLRPEPTIARTASQRRAHPSHKHSTSLASIGLGDSAATIEPKIDLDLSYFSLGSRRCAALSRSFQYQTSELCSISLRGNRLTSIDIGVLCSALARSAPNLERLDISDN